MECGTASGDVWIVYFVAMTAGGGKYLIVMDYLRAGHLHVNNNPQSTQSALRRDIDLNKRVCFNKRVPLFNNIDQYQMTRH